jgi:putative membrane protein insertion efficiency factor
MAKDNQSLQSNGKKINTESKSTKPLSVLTLPFRCVIKGYQVFISPMLGQNCRFHPSCSCYAHQALETHGLVKGTWLSVKRIMKCNPMHPGGFDYVPGTTDNTTIVSDKVETVAGSSEAPPKNKL